MADFSNIDTHIAHLQQKRARLAPGLPQVLHEYNFSQAASTEAAQAYEVMCFILEHAKECMSATRAMLVLHEAKINAIIDVLPSTPTRPSKL